MKYDRKIVGVLLLAVNLTACSPRARLNTLNFFFDGVPANVTDTMVPPAGTQGFALRPVNDSSLAMRQNTYSYHQPYQEKNCTACHDISDVGSLVKDEPALCYACHQDFSVNSESLHGPVDAGFCSSCHDPHMSRDKTLLISPGNALCNTCHLNEQVKQPPEHEDIGKALCITCHDPHVKKTVRKIAKPIPLER
jgi:predicted CXXCH cytochrome family protein